MTSLQERLFAIQDKQYAAFQAKLTPGVPMESFIGIRVPVLRKFAKEFTKEAECEDFLRRLSFFLIPATSGYTYQHFRSIPPLPD